MSGTRLVLALVTVLTAPSVRAGLIEAVRESLLLK
jgi:hypothetical protein